jgi:hypothetical protein
MKQIFLITFLYLIVLTTSFAQKSSIRYDTDAINNELVFKYPDTLNNTFLRQLRNEYDLLKLTENKLEDIDKVLLILNWTHNQWKHNGSNEPSKNDALTILKEAKDGKKFRCVEYGIVSSSALQALNYKSRVLGLKTADVETKRYSAGHVLAEVWMPQFNKWVLIDGQFNVMPILENVPLNAVEFQQAISENKKYKLIDINGEVSEKRRKSYVSFVFDYLYYLDARFDNRNIPSNESVSYQGKSSLMLVPLGAKNPSVFQIKYPLDHLVYTNSTNDFYQKPKNN